MTYCTAVTGKADCKLIADQVHRCELDVNHAEPGVMKIPVTERVVHKCVCGYRWTCLTGSIDDLMKMLFPEKEGAR